MSLVSSWLEVKQDSQVCKESSVEDFEDDKARVLRNVNAKMNQFLGTSDSMSNSNRTFVVNNIDSELKDSFLDNLE